MDGLEVGVVKKLRKVTICLASILGVLLYNSAGSAQDRPAPVKEITVAVGQDSAPFYFRDQKGVADGWLVDIWRLWSEKTGIKIRFVVVPFGETLHLTKEGKVDVQGGCFYSEERATYLDYVAPLADCDTHFFFHKNIYGIETLKDLMGFHIGVIEGDYAVGYLLKHLPGAGLAQYATNEELFQALEKGDLRVFVMDTPIALYFLEKSGLLSSFNYYPGRPLYSNAYRAAVKKGNPSLASVVNKGLDMISPEEKAAIERRWGGVSQTQAEGVLTIACDRYYPPFTMLTPSGRAAGILIDFWRLWSTRNVRKIEFVFDDWEKTIQMVRDGKADIHSGLYKTRQREEFLAFSVPIFAAQDNLAFRTDQDPLSLSELSGKKVGVIAGSAEEMQLKEDYPGIILSPYGGYRELLKALENYEVRAVYDVGVTLQRAIAEQGLQGEIEVSTESGPIRHIFAGILKKNVARLKAINHGINQITEQELQDIEARWIPNQDFRMFSGKARPLVLTAEEKDWLKAHAHISLGIDPHFMPFESVSKNGVYEGISSGYVSILNEKLGVDMRPVKGLNWQQVMAAVKAGEVDVLPCVAMTKERSEFLQFTRPYLDFQVVAATRKDAPFIADLKGLKGAKVAVVKGYFVSDMLKQDFPEIALVPVDTIEQGLKTVAEGEAAAYVDNSAAIIYAIRELGLKDLKIATTTQYRSSLRFGVRKDWPELAAILDKALQSIPEQEREKIADRWINIRFTERTDWGFVLKGSIAVAVIIGLILAMILFWNRRLSREVGERKRAEDRFQAIASATPGAIIQLRFDDEGRPEYLYLSPRAEVFFGMPPEQVIGGKGRLPWHPEDLERIKEEVRTNLLTEADMNHVGRIISEDGAVKWIRLNASPSRNAEGELIYNGFILDITNRKLAEQEHIRSERKIKAMSQAAEDALVMIDGQGKVLFWNPAAEKLFGYTEAEAMGMDFHRIAAPEMYHEKIYAGLKHFAEAGEGPVLGTTTEITARNRNGDEFPVEVTLSSFQVDEEWFAVGTVRDITERKEAEEAIKNSEQRMADLIDFMPDPILVIDMRGKVIFWNRAMENLTGVKKENVLGKGDYEYALPFYGERRPILVDLVRQWDHALEKQYLSVKKEGDCLVSESFHPHMGDGGIYLSGIAAVLYDAEGKAVGSIESLRDITDRKQAEDAMKESERKLKTILETASEGFFIVNNDNEVIDVNPTMCGILARERDEVLTMSIFDFADEENKRIFYEQIELRKQGITSAYEIAISRPDGSHVFCIFNSTPLYDENNEKIGAFAMVTDITDRKQAEDRLKFTQTTVDKAALNIFWVDPETGMFKYANDAACHSLGYTREELMGMHVPQIDAEFTEEKFGGLMAALKEHSHVETEGIHSTKDGRMLNVSLSIVLTRLENREIVTVFSRDITDKLKAEKELKERLEELEQFSRLVVGRELKMIALKEEVNELLEDLGREEKYEIVQ